MQGGKIDTVFDSPEDIGGDESRLGEAFATVHNPVADSVDAVRALENGLKAGKDMPQSGGGIVDLGGGFLTCAAAVLNGATDDLVVLTLFVE